MNVLLNKAKKQAGNAQEILTRFEELLSIDSTNVNIPTDDRVSREGAPLQSEVSVALTLLGQTIRDMDSLMAREMDMAKRAQHKESVKEIQALYSDMKMRHDGAKQRLVQRTQESTRQALLRHPDNKIERRSGLGQHHDSPDLPQDPKDSMSTQSQSAPYSFDQASNSLDQYIQMGTATLSDLQQQRNLLKGTHRRLLDFANILGLSQSVIRWIDIRNRQDQYIFYFGTILTLLVLLWLCYRFIG